jgi:hypothetical protein
LSKSISQQANTFDKRRREENNMVMHYEVQDGTGSHADGCKNRSRDENHFPIRIMRRTRRTRVEAVEGRRFKAASSEELGLGNLA